MEIEPSSGSLTKSYIYVADPPSLGRADRQILAQHDGDISDARYFYLHDRLGSPRLLIDEQGAVDNTYTYEPFGEMLTPECTENVSNPFKFTGQYFDSEIEEYYLRARQYNPYLALFSSRDPVLGKLREPASLHPYLYCLNDPTKRTDPAGEFAGILASAKVRARDTTASAGAAAGRTAACRKAPGGKIFWEFAKISLHKAPLCR